jgi:hypothetical protein
MVAMYCRDHHATGAKDDGEGLCDDCAGLLAYARRRLEKCRYGAGKPTCARCETHCYGPAMRERVRDVMRYSGPRMVRRHPLLAAAHLADGRSTPRGGGSRADDGSSGGAGGDPAGGGAGRGRAGS